MQATYDVIIAGAGPVGLFLGCELALANCSVLILEKSGNPRSPLKRLPFGIRGLTTPTVEALYRRGLLEELQLHKRIKNPHKTADPAGPRRQGGHFAGISFLDGNIDSSRWSYRVPTSTDTSVISEMAELEDVLQRRAEELGVVIIRGLAVTDIEQCSDAVIVRSGETAFQGRWLVGCDGSRSVVRKAGTFEFAGTEPEFTGYSAQLEIADPEKLNSGRNLTPTGMYFQSQPDYLVMVEFDGGRAHGTEPPTRERIQEVLRRVSSTDVTVKSLHAATTWTDRARQATAYRHGRILLAGDAAHIHAPLGGQGLNLGLGDALNLGWKLAATIHETAPEDLLDSYEVERHPVGEQVLDWSRAQVAIMKPDAGSRAINAVVRDLIGTRDGATYFAERVWGVHMRYDLGADHPLVGRSVPNIQLDNGTTIGELMHDGRAMLLDFEPNDAHETLASRYGDSIKYVSASAKDRFDLSAVLIRPDGIVAWASESDADVSEIEKAAHRWFVSRAKLE